MRIGIDTHFITTGHATGNRTYTSQLVRALIEIDQENEYILYAIDDHPYYQQFSTNHRVKVRAVLPQNGLIRNFFSIPIEAARDKLDLIHLHLLPPTLMVPCLLAVHDLYYLHAANPTIRERAIGRFAVWSAQRANHIVTLSEFSRQDIIHRTGVKPSRVTVVPLAMDQRFHLQPGYFPDPAILSRLGIIKDYILFVGRTDDPRKNVMTLIEAYAAIKPQLPEEIQVAIAGRQGADIAQINSRISEFGLTRDIILLGPVPDELLPDLLAGARVFVLASSFEGFGLPVLEAMACGAPVITSNSTSLPEVAGNAALLVTPTNVEELANALQRVLCDEELRKDLIQRGHERASLFSWDLAAHRTLDAYGRAVRSTP